MKELNILIHYRTGMGTASIWFSLHLPDEICKLKLSDLVHIAYNHIYI